MKMIDLDFESAIFYYTSYETKNWRKALAIAEEKSCKLEEKRRLSWVWPKEENLRELQKILLDLKVRTVLSIGCGCGLFEWFLRESIGLNIYGLECDRSWWHSSHAVKNFIKLSFIDDLEPNCLPETFMQRCCDIHDRTNWEFAIMFVYFNNRVAFLNYLKMYKGQWIIIVGPKTGFNIHTDPLPLEPNFPNKAQWELCEQMTIGVHDVLAVYKNLDWKVEK